METLNKINKTIDSLILKLDENKSDILQLLKIGGVFVFIYFTFKLWRHYNGK